MDLEPISGWNFYCVWRFFFLGGTISGSGDFFWGELLLRSGEFFWLEFLMSLLSFSGWNFFFLKHFSGWTSGNYKLVEHFVVLGTFCELYFAYK